MNMLLSKKHHSYCFLEDKFTSHLSPVLHVRYLAADSILFHYIFVLLFSGLELWMQSSEFSYDTIYQPLRSGRIWHKVSF